MSTVHDSQDPLDREYASGWTPEEGEIVRGTVVDVDLAHRDADYGGGEYPVITIRLAEGRTATTKHGTVTDEVAIHALHSQLAGKLAAIEPKVGDEIGAKYVGEPVGDARAKRYRVDRSHDGGGSPSNVDWGPYRFPGDEPAQSSMDAERAEDVEDLGETQAAIERERDARDESISF